MNKKIKHLCSILCCIIFLAIIYLLLNRLFNFEYMVDSKENWLDYTINPLGDNNIIKDEHPYIDSGFDPINFYSRDRYRKPYRFPFTFYKSYPVQHKTYLP